MASLLVTDSSVSVRDFLKTPFTLPSLWDRVSCISSRICGILYTKADLLHSGFSNSLSSASAAPVKERVRSSSSLSNVIGSSEPVDEDRLGPDEAAENNELGAHVHDSIQRLSPKLRAILVLRYLEQLSYGELCVALEVSLGTVRSRLARAHMALQRVLVGTLEPFGFRAASDGRYSFGPQLDTNRQEGVV